LQPVNVVLILTEMGRIFSFSGDWGYMYQR